MNLSPKQRKILGVISFYPLLYSSLNLLVFVYAFISIEKPKQIVKVLIDLLSYLEIPSLLILAVLIIGYLKFVFKTEFKTDNKRMDWAAAIVFFSIFSIPLFWFMYIRRMKTE